MYVRKSKDTKAPKVLMHKIADVRGGVSLDTSAMIGEVIMEGAIIATNAGKYVLLPTAKVVEAVTSSGKVIKVAKNHGFKANDFVTAGENAVASKINTIDSSNKAYDVLNVATAIGALNIGDAVAGAKSATTSADSQFAFEPFAVAGTTKKVESAKTDMDAWVVGVTKNIVAPDSVVAKLKGIVNVK